MIRSFTQYIQWVNRLLGAVDGLRKVDPRVEEDRVPIGEPAHGARPQPERAERLVGEQGEDSGEGDLEQGRNVQDHRVRRQRRLRPGLQRIGVSLKNSHINL